MKDMFEGINKAIADYENTITFKNGKKFELSAAAKELVEYGYIQCSLQIGYDLTKHGTTFINGLIDSTRIIEFIDKEIKRWDDIVEKNKEIEAESIKEMINNVIHHKYGFEMTKEEIIRIQKKKIS